jgi:hypothetical protein
MRKRVDFVKGYFYLIYNRGVDKKNIFVEESDYMRFMQYQFFKKMGGRHSG